MKITVRERVYGMGMQLGEARSRIEHGAMAIATHVVSCIVYGNLLDYYNSWIDQTLTSELLKVGNTETNTKTKRLPKEDYRNRTFKFLSGSLEVVGQILEEIYDERVIKKHNKKFDVNSKSLQNAVKECSKEFSDTFCDMFCKKHKDFSKEDIQNTLHKILDKYCLDTNKDWFDF